MLGIIRVPRFRRVEKSFDEICFECLSADCARTCYLNHLAPNLNHCGETHNANSNRLNNLLKIGFNFKKLGLNKQYRHQNSMISTAFEMFKKILFFGTHILGMPYLVLTFVRQR